MSDKDTDTDVIPFPKDDKSDVPPALLTDAPAIKSDGFDFSTVINVAKGVADVTKTVVGAFLPQTNPSPTPAPAPTPQATPVSTAQPGQQPSPAANTTPPSQQKPANPPPMVAAPNPPEMKGYSTGQKVGIGVAVTATLIGLGMIVSSSGKSKQPQNEAL